MTRKPPQNNNERNHLLHPYIFVLKEGKEIKKDFLDYSLMMLFVHPEVLKAQKRDQRVVQQTLTLHVPQNRIPSQPAQTPIV